MGLNSGSPHDDRCLRSQLFRIVSSVKQVQKAFGKCSTGISKRFEHQPRVYAQISSLSRWKDFDVKSTTMKPRLHLSWNRSALVSVRWLAVVGILKIPRPSL